ncbi:MAG: phage terminase large subunit [Candidatus Heimdallarchaeaceae archaeon]
MSSEDQFDVRGSLSDREIRRRDSTKFIELEKENIVVVDKHKFDQKWEVLGKVPDREMVIAALCKKSLRHMVKYSWDIVVNKPYYPNWHIDAICDHLEAVTRGDIRNLIINIPPRHTKSTIVSVVWPAWEWISSPQVQWLFSSYTHSLTKRDNVKCRRLIQSAWYQRLFGSSFHLVLDQNEKIKYENNHGGYRLATSVEGAGTGEGGDRLVFDDPNNVRDSESSIVRGNTNIWFGESMLSRRNDPKKSSITVIQQRTHSMDVTGYCLSTLTEDMDWEHLCLPAFYEGRKKWVYTGPGTGLKQVDRKPHEPMTSIGFEDPRTEIDEVLHPSRAGKKELHALVQGAYARAGQLQQRPSPRGGGLFEIENFVIVNNVPRGVKFLSKVRYWDKAGTEGGGKFSSGVLMGKTDGGSYDYVVLDVCRGQWSISKRERMIRQIAELDGPDVEVWIEQEPGSSGKESSQLTIKRLAGFVAKADRVTGSKETRADSFSGQVEEKNVAVLNRHWTKDFIEEHEKFPSGLYKDQVDAASGAFSKIAGVMIESLVW